MISIFLRSSVSVVLHRWRPGPGPCRLGRCDPVKPSPRSAALAAASTLRRSCLADSPKTGVWGSNTSSVDLIACRASAAARPMYRTVPSACWSVLDWGMWISAAPSARNSTSLHRRLAASDWRRRPSRSTDSRARSTRPRVSAFSWDSWRLPAPFRARRPVAVALTAARASAVRGLACRYAFSLDLKSHPLLVSLPREEWGPRGRWSGGSRR